VPGQAQPSKPEDLRALIKRAHEGDATTLPALRELFNNPHSVEIYGNLAKIAEERLIRKVAGKDLAFTEGKGRKLESLRV
jgi:hypothetical protein